MREEHHRRDYWCYLEEPTPRLKEVWLSNYHRIVRDALEQQIIEDEASESLSSSSDEPLARRAAIARPRAVSPGKKGPPKPNNNTKRARTLKVSLQGDYNLCKPVLEQLRADQELSRYQFRRVLNKYLNETKLL